MPISWCNDSGTLRPKHHVALATTQFQALWPRGWLSARPKKPRGWCIRVFAQYNTRTITQCAFARCLRVTRPKHRWTRRPRAKYASHGGRSHFAEAGCQSFCLLAKAAALYAVHNINLRRVAGAAIVWRACTSLLQRGSYSKSRGGLSQAHPNFIRRRVNVKARRAHDERKKNVSN